MADLAHHYATLSEATFIPDGMYRGHVIRAEDFQNFVGQHVLVVELELNRDQSADTFHCRLAATRFGDSNELWCVLAPEHAESVDVYVSPDVLMGRTCAVCVRTVSGEFNGLVQPIWNQYAIGADEEAARRNMAERDL